MPKCGCHGNVKNDGYIVKFRREINDQLQKVLTSYDVDIIFLQARYNRRPVSSVGRAPDFFAGGLGFEPRPDQHSGS